MLKDNKGKMQMFYRFYNNVMARGVWILINNGISVTVMYDFFYKRLIIINLIPTPSWSSMNRNSSRYQVFEFFTVIKSDNIY